MMKKEQGFTLIELVAVIVILGALAVVALPRFINLQDEADQAAVEGVAGSLSSGMAINFAGCSAVNHSTGQDECLAVASCSDGESTLQGGTLPTDYSISGGTIDSSNNGVSKNDCVVENTAATVSATFTGISAGY